MLFSTRGTRCRRGCSAAGGKAYIILPAPADELLAGAYPGTPDDAG